MQSSDVVSVSTATTPASQASAIHASSAASVVHGLVAASDRPGWPPTRAARAATQAPGVPSDVSRLGRRRRRSVAPAGASGRARGLAHAGPRPSPARATSAGSTFAGSTPVASATRRVMAVNSIALRKAISRSGSAVCARRARRAARRAARPGRASTSLREMRACSAIWIRLSRRLGCLISAARAEQRLEVAILGDELRGGLHADARHARHVVDASRRAAPARRSTLSGVDAEFLEHLVRRRCRLSFIECRTCIDAVARRAASGPCRRRRW